VEGGRGKGRKGRGKGRKGEGREGEGKREGRGREGPPTAFWTNQTLHAWPSSQQVMW